MNYKRLNEYADNNGTVIMGGKNDKNIPLCELKQAFSINEKLYNRSSDDLSVSNAVNFYTDFVSELSPKSIFLHIGENDEKMFSDSPDKFTDAYRELISYIKGNNKNCRIAIVSMKNNGNDNFADKINKQLKYIADSEKCEFCDISEERISDYRQEREVISFVYDIGFVQRLTHPRPLGDLARILFER